MQMIYTALLAKHLPLVKSGRPMCGMCGKCWGTGHKGKLFPLTLQEMQQELQFHGMHQPKPHVEDVVRQAAA